MVYENLPSKCSDYMLKLFSSPTAKVIVPLNFGFHHLDCIIRHLNFPILAKNHPTRIAAILPIAGNFSMFLSNLRLLEKL